MVEDIHMASIVCAARKTVLKPKSTTLCFAKHKNHAKFQNKFLKVTLWIKVLLVMNQALWLEM